MAAEVSNKTNGKIKKKQSSQLRLGLLLAAPALIYILIFMAFPLFYNFFLSLTEANGANLITRTFTFNNFKNYTTVLHDHEFWNGLVLSLIFTIACLVSQYVIGFALALFFRRPFPGNGVMRALLLVGWILPPVVTGTIFKWIFDSDYGILNYVLINMGVINEGIKWLTVGPTALLAIIIANLWVGIPFNLLLLLSGLHTIDDSLYEAAHVDGANPWQQFWKITFPLMKPVSISVLLLGVINTYKVFDLIYTMTKGGPVDATSTLPVYTYLETYKLFQFGNGAAASVLTLILPLVLSWFYVRSLNEEDLR
ncbi:carbohydrate ABC transporter permease [Mobiluncus curtisii]|uniref:Inner membrane ABC transporter permease protein ycjO n=2 Tax=Mobiluncus curtisii TaxID=2051 RepID=A0A2X3ANW4_9ACTO|nr:sugar ABC transporter permease [Mobiluncus curtisii]ADI67914.1 putative type IV conjugative transfer system protein TraL [Mobiluncus curtisii ATCC 43063]MCU9987506.1 sugar ABC transporter permease [Mobiluncus curtisii]MCV0000419.1 sugar ABC transporter permease [Mobiluncus curtisii]MCV0021526.1 sugar ABC transporter permease [Mobiluncus curtisii]NMW49475.1 sugar ABC transporter permease [Mobiluncus curtisii]